MICVLSWLMMLCVAACRIRDLNDEINKLIREKGHWERRIVELGGPDYAKTAPKLTDTEGQEMDSSRGGYRWVAGGPAGHPPAAGGTTNEMPRCRVVGPQLRSPYIHSPSHVAGYCVHSATTPAAVCATRWLEHRHLCHSTQLGLDPS
jgi:hypothetical protein